MTSQDEQHLRALSIGFYVYAGLQIAVALLSVVFVALGIGIFQGAFPAGSAKGPPPPEVFGYFFLVIGGLAVMAGLTWAFLNGVAGWALARRRYRIYCIVVAALNCLNVPMGTVLGVLTIMVLTRDSVKPAFEA
jgi:hypothetical protein